MHLGRLRSGALGSGASFSRRERAAGGARGQLPWFRAHVQLANDPGRLLGVHLAHSGLLAGWAAAMLAYELLLFDPSDPVFDPAWRQGSFALPFCSRLGLARGASSLSGALFGWEDSIVAHAALAGLLLVAGSWHWAFWDLDLFVLPSRALALHFARLFGVHLTLASGACFAFGCFHLMLAGAGFWTTDSFGSFGCARPLLPAFSPLEAALLRYGSLAGHHVGAGALLSVAGCWHAAALPGPALWAALGFGSGEGILASSLSACFVPALLNAALVWYGGPAAPADLFGATRFSWDSSFYSQQRAAVDRGWASATEGLLLFDYVGAGPAKGGLFRAGPMVKGDGLVQAWVGHAAFGSFTAGRESRLLAPRRMPAFFESFPVLLVDERGLPRAVIPFRRSDSKYAVSGSAGLGSVSASFAGGTFDLRALRAASAVKAFARKAQLGEIFSFGSARADGVFRSSARGWFTYSHAALALLFAVGHLWHAGRALFKDIWTGARLAGAPPEYGALEKLAGA